MKPFLKLFTITFCLAFIGCYDNLDNSTEREITAQPEIKINTEIAGLIRNSDGSLLNDYTVQVGSNSQVIDGAYFHLSLEGVNKYGQAIEIRQNDELVGFFHTNLIENDLNIIEFDRFHDLESKTIDVGVHNELIINQNISIILPIASVSNNTISYGEINNPQLISSAFSNKHQLLKPENATVFMIHEGLPNVSGNTFGEPMQIKVNNGLQSQSLFRFDALKSEWLEVTQLMDGEISLDMIFQGLFAIADKHWGVTLEGQVSNANNDRISYQQIRLEENGIEEELKSTLSGQWAVVAKEFTDYQINLLDPCGFSLQQNQQSTQDRSQQGLNFLLDSGDFYYHAEGRIIDCAGDPINLGIIQVESDIYVTNFFTNSNEQNLVIPVCGESFNLSVIDLLSGNQGPSIPWDVNLTMDYISSCEDHLDGFSFLKIRDDREIYDAFTVSEMNGIVTLESSDGNLKFIIEGMSIGEYQDGQVNIKIQDENFGSNGYAMSCENPDFECGISSCLMSHYKTGEKQWVRVVLEGELWMQTINPPQAGNFEVKGSILTQF